MHIENTDKTSVTYWLNQLQNLKVSTNIFLTINPFIEIDENKISDASSEVFILFDKEVNWRKDAAQNLMPELEKYNEVIKNNIGLRLQSRLTKEQAKFVASCNSIHRDISLNF